MLLHSKENHKQNEKTTHRKRKYLQRKWLTRDCSPKSTTARAILHPKNKKTNKKQNQIQKWAEDLNRHDISP